MGNLYNIGVSGLQAAQLKLATASHNIDNAETAGYNRQTVMVSTAGGTPTSYGFVGRGVKVDTIMREYNSFLYDQLINAQSKGSHLFAEFEQLSQIDNSLGDNTKGIPPAIEQFFSSLNGLANGPSDSAARQFVIEAGKSLVTQINNAQAELQNQREGLNAQLDINVVQINTYLENIRDLNKQIVISRGTSNNQPPNDLLDQRDQAIAELNQLVGIKTYVDGDSVNVTLASGPALLAGNQVFKLQTVSSSADAQRKVLAYSLLDSSGTIKPVELDDKLISGGKLGGLVQFRVNSLDKIQNSLGQFAVGLAHSFNDIHTQGRTLTGAVGSDFFNVPNPVAIANSKNSSAGLIPLNAVYADINQLTGSDYKVAFDGTNYQVTRLSDNAVMGTTSGPGTTLTFDGLTLTLPATASTTGDQWLLTPTRDAARNLSQVISNPNDIAAADSSGTSDTTENAKNALALAQLQNKKILSSGGVTLNEFYSRIVNIVGVTTQQSLANNKTQVAVVDQKMAYQQGASGVNLKVEELKLIQYQEQFSACSRIIDAATKIFDTILALRS